MLQAEVSPGWSHVRGGRHWSREVCRASEPNTPPNNRIVRRRSYGNGRRVGYGAATIMGARCYASSNQTALPSTLQSTPHELDSASTRGSPRPRSSRSGKPARSRGGS
jgi:hypothetical protein